MLIRAGRLPGNQRGRESWFDVSPVLPKGECSTAGRARAAPFCWQQWFQLLSMFYAEACPQVSASCLCSQGHFTDMATMVYDTMDNEFLKTRTSEKQQHVLLANMDCTVHTYWLVGWRQPWVQANELQKLHRLPARQPGSSMLLPSSPHPAARHKLSLTHHIFLDIRVPLS